MTRADRVPPEARRRVMHARLHLLMATLAVDAARERPVTVNVKADLAGIRSELDQVRLGLLKPRRHRGQP